MFTFLQLLFPVAFTGLGNPDEMISTEHFFNLLSGGNALVGYLGRGRDPQEVLTLRRHQAPYCLLTLTDILTRDAQTARVCN